MAATTVTHRILVIDDDSAVQALFLRILSLGGTGATAQAASVQFEVDCVSQGAEGVAAAGRALDEGRPHALAFVDLRMPPGWDGIETARRLWEADPALQVVICTGAADVSPATLASLGRTDRLLILKKPFDPLEVLQLASALTEKWSLARQVRSHLDTLKALVEERTRELHRSLSLLQAALDATADGILVVDNQGRVVNFNETLTALWRIPGGSLKECDQDQLLAPLLRQLGDPAAFRKQIIETLARPDLETEGELELQDGRCFEHSSRPQVMAGEILGRVWSFRDITHHKQAERALRDSENQYRLLFESNPTPIYVYGQGDLRFLAANAAAIRCYGYSREEFLSRALPELALPEEIPLFLAGLPQGPDESRPPQVWRHRRKDGGLLQMEITSHTLVFAGTRAWLSLAIDVTERLSLEAQLRQSQKMDSVGQLAGGIAHDFNNLLTVINGHTGMLLAREPLSPQIAEPLREVSEAARRAADLTRQLLAFSRKQVLHLRVVDLNEVVNNITKMLRRILGEDIALNVAFSPNLPAVKADLGMIEQVLLNLAVNARDAMPQGGQLFVETAPVTIDTAHVQQNPEAAAGRCVCLTFRDTGCGIAPENLPRIFEPFFTTKELDRGTGLGLATVYGIIKQHQGWITVTSGINQGATFQIFLPGCGEPVGELPRTPAEQRVIGGTDTILVVEDEAPLLKLIHHILESYGYKVLESSSGRGALEIWRQHADKIDLLLTDLILPDGMAGSELAAILKAAKPDLKVIYTSGYDPQRFAREFTAGESGNFIQKPFHARKLAETVYDCLNGR